MNLLRNSLIGAILVVAFLLFIRWNEFQERHAVAPTTNTTTSSSEIYSDTDNIDTDPVAIEIGGDSEVSEDNDIPALPEPDIIATPAIEEAPSAALIHVVTDSLDALIDTKGGDIVKIALPKHLADQDSSEPFTLLNRNQSHLYIAQSGLLGTNGTDVKNKPRPIYAATQKSFEMKEDEDTLVVDLTLNQDSAIITKRFTFSRNSYLIDIEYIIDNRSDKPWSGASYAQIKRDRYIPKSTVGIGMSSYTGAAITTPDSNYKKKDFGDIDDETFEVEQPGGWVAMVQHYFVSAIVPDAEQKNLFYLQKTRNNYYLMGYRGSLVTIPPQSVGKTGFSFYSGPKHIKQLEKISPHLELTIDYGLLWFIAKPLFYGLDYIHSKVNNWGIAIILLTVLIKLVFFYPSAMSYRSMAKMRKLQPIMMDLKERFGDDRQKMSAELMKMYKKEKVNPLGGCLPILMQMPVFIALYWSLMESVELRHSPFYLWITDLSIKDPFFVLPLIMGATMYFQQKLNPTPPDPMQAKVMQMMPIFFTFLFMMFPAGLVLYWVVNNALSIAQQYVITRQIEQGDKS